MCFSNRHFELRNVAVARVWRTSTSYMSIKSMRCYCNAKTFLTNQTCPEHERVPQALCSSFHFAMCSRSRQSLSFDGLLSGLGGYRVALTITITSTYYHLQRYTCVRLHASCFCRHWSHHANMPRKAASLNKSRNARRKTPSRCTIQIGQGFHWTIKPYARWIWYCTFKLDKQHQMVNIQFDYTVSNLSKDEPTENRRI